MLTPSFVVAARVSSHTAVFQVSPFNAPERVADTIVGTRRGSPQAYTELMTTSRITMSFIIIIKL